MHVLILYLCVRVLVCIYCIYVLFFAVHLWNPFKFVCIFVRINVYIYFRMYVYLYILNMNCVSPAADGYPGPGCLHSCAGLTAVWLQHGSHQCTPEGR